MLMDLRFDCPFCGQCKHYFDSENRLVTWDAYDRQPCEHLSALFVVSGGVGSTHFVDIDANDDGCFWLNAALPQTADFADWLLEELLVPEDIQRAGGRIEIDEQRFEFADGELSSTSGISIEDDSDGDDNDGELHPPANAVRVSFNVLALWAQEPRRTATELAEFFAYVQTDTN